MIPSIPPEATDATSGDCRHVFFGLDNVQLAYIVENNLYQCCWTGRTALCYRHL